MYPVMWAETGRPPERLVDDLVDARASRGTAATPGRSVTSR